MTIAGTDVRVPVSSGTTDAGVRAVATVMSAPWALRPDMISLERGDMRESVLRSVPSRSLT